MSVKTKKKSGQQKKPMMNSDFGYIVGISDVSCVGESPFQFAPKKEIK